MSARRAWIALVAAAAYVPACFFELAAVEDVDSGLNGSGAGGSGGMGAGGSDDDASVDVSCATGETLCAGECVGSDDPTYGCGSCTPCALADVAQHQCEPDGCAIVECAAGFGDCNGNSDDGCETEFAVDWPTRVEPPTFPLVIPQLPMTVTVNGAGDEWASEPRQPVAEVCESCAPLLDNIPQVLDLGPSAQDLTAWFRLAWDSSFLYAFVEVRDDDIVSTSTEGMYPEARQDGIELLIGADSMSTDYGNKNHQLFFALDGSIAKPNLERPEALLAIARGRECYSAELRIPWRYITGNTMSEAQAELEVRFDLAVNDWDTVPQDGGALSQRQSQLFWKDPGDRYWDDTLGLGSIRLE